MLILHTLESLLYVAPSVVMTYTYRFCMACNFSKGIKKHEARSGYFRWEGRHHFLMCLIITLDPPSKGRGNKFSVAKWGKECMARNLRFFKRVTLKSTNRATSLYTEKKVLASRQISFCSCSSFKYKVRFLQLNVKYVVPLYSLKQSGK